MKPPKLGPNPKKPTSAEGNTKNSSPTDDLSQSKIISYKLSNEDYVQQSWTKKPVVRKVKRVVFYETKLVKPYVHWHRGVSQRLYEDGSVFLINAATEGRVYYPSGDLAVSLKKREKNNYDLITVYSTGNRNAFGVVKKPRVIGLFDTLGNGLVLSEDGDVRLSYNQIGGICIDNPGARLPLVWLWTHRKYPVMESNYPEAEAVRLMKYFPSGGGKVAKTVQQDGTSCFRESSDDSYEKNDDFLTAVKPICLKLNRNLSLRILDRRHIKLRFLCGKQTARFQLGFDVDFTKPVSSFLKDITNDHHNFLKSRIEEQLTLPEPNVSLLSTIEEFKQLNENYGRT